MGLFGASLLEFQEAPLLHLQMLFLDRLVSCGLLALIFISRVLSPIVSDRFVVCA